MAPCTGFDFEIDLRVSIVHDHFVVVRAGDYDLRISEPLNHPSWSITIGTIWVVEPSSVNVYDVSRPFICDDGLERRMFSPNQK